MKKAQAALEFLSTYGWAFLIILVMIGALAYFGVLNTNTFLPERCQFESPFSCTDYHYASDISAPIVHANLVNNLGKSVKIINATLTCSGTTGTCEVCSSPTWCQLNTSSSGDDPTFWPAEEQRILTFHVNGGNPSDLLKVEATINYIPANAYFIQTSKGNILIKG